MASCLRDPPPPFILKLALEVEDLILDRDFHVKVIKTDLIGDKIKYSILSLDLTFLELICFCVPF